MMDTIQHIAGQAANVSWLGQLIGAGIIGLCIIGTMLWAWFAALRPELDYRDEHTWNDDLPWPMRERD